MKFRLRSDGNLSIGNFSAYAQADAYRKEMPKPGIWVVERIPPQPLALDDRERDTIMAALRLWQAEIVNSDSRIGDELVAIAENGRVDDEGADGFAVYAALTGGEIGALVERINGEG